MSKALSTNSTITPTTTAATGSGQVFNGDSTKYGAAGNGACQSKINDVDKSVALNGPTYGNTGQISSYCGKYVCVCGVKLEILISMELHGRQYGHLIKMVVDSRLAGLMANARNK
jgi:hypothetical protein